MAEDLQDKTEEATSKKLKDSRNKGQVAKSQDLTSAFLLLLGMIVLSFYAPYFYSKLAGLSVAVLNHLTEPFATPSGLVFWFRKGLLFIVLLAAPILLVMMIGGLAINIAQVSFVISTEALQPKWKNLNVFDVSSYKKFFNTQALSKLAFGLLKLTVIGLVCYWIILASLLDLMRLVHAGPGDLFMFLCWEALKIGITVAVILLVLGIGEYIFQKWKFAQDQKMTKQEVKDERRQTEGDVHMKSKMRSMMQQFTQSRMKDNVPQADVIIANPIHFAVAIKYDPETMPAPMCVAKGTRRMALAIREVAEEHDVPIVENPLLARGLYQTVELGGYVPPDMYHTVAEVLAYVYRLNEEMGRKIKGAPV